MSQPGIEPGSITWRPKILPLNHRCLIGPCPYSVCLTIYGISAVFSWLIFKALIFFYFESNSLLQSYRFLKWVNQLVESTCNRKRDYSMAGDNSFTELSKLAGLLSAFPLFCDKIRLSVVVRQLEFVRQLKYKDFIYDIVNLNSLLQSYRR